MLFGNGDRTGSFNVSSDGSDSNVKFCMRGNERGVCVSVIGICICNRSGDNENEDDGGGDDENEDDDDGDNDNGDDGCGNDVDAGGGRFLKKSDIGLFFWTFI